MTGIFDIKDLKQVEKWLLIYNENYMSKELPRNFLIQNKINSFLGLSEITYKNNGLATMNLDRGTHLKLYQAILKGRQRCAEEVFLL